MKIVVFTLLIIITQITSSAKDLDIYLLIGQSNMAGRAPYSEAEAQPIEGVFLLNELSLIHISEPTRPY